MQFNSLKNYKKKFHKSFFDIISIKNSKKLTSSTGRSLEKDILPMSFSLSTILVGVTSPTSYVVNPNTYIIASRSAEIFVI